MFGTRNYRLLLMQEVKKKIKEEIKKYGKLNENGNTSKLVGYY